MKAYVISIGSELLDGFTVNSNAAFISRMLAEHSVATVGHLVIPDTPSRLLDAFAVAGQQAECIIVTGGLGPTCDDTTREAVATFFDAPLTFNPAVAARLEERYGAALPTLQDQATLPAGITILPNPFGTASGLYATQEESHYFFLPGVPQEMEAICSDAVLPQIDALNQTRRHHVWRYYSALIEADIDPYLREIEAPHIDIGIYPCRGIVVVHLSGLDLATLNAAIAPLDAAWGSHCFATAPTTIEATIHSLFIDNGLTLSVAESCSGGGLAARLTAIPGASHYFHGAIVSYSNDLKKQLLGVTAATLDQYGAVSAETATEMVTGLLEQTKTDYGIAVTGIAGPGGGGSDKPVGSLYIAIARRHHAPQVLSIRGRGSRQMITTFSIHRALGALYFAVKEK